MKSRLGAVFMIASGMLLAALPIWAHHSFAAEYDSTKTVTVKGTIQELKWVNPHAYVYVDVKDANGKALPSGTKVRITATLDFRHLSPYFIRSWRLN